VVAAVLPDARSQRRLDGQTVLWVHDRPDNNRSERQALEALGVRVHLSSSTEHALARSAYQHFDLIISDMGCPGDRPAGFTLLEGLRNRADHTPFVIYAGTASPEQRAEAVRRGALGQTNSPTELIRLATAGLAGRAR
jgi:DNA-binding NtrC family response regulator